MNILNRVKSFHPGPVCKSVVLFVVLLSLALIFWFLSLEHNTSNTSFFWVNVIDISWSLLFLASWIQLIRVDKIFKRNYPNKPGLGFFVKPTHPVKRALMVVFTTLAVILLFSSCVIWCAAAVQ
ncbi:MAG: hypothetical protein J6Y92_07240 [Lentisphaeria bacterium]|nr:hypothetical protein [Lentisphaeria bacterium]